MNVENSVEKFKETKLKGLVVIEYTFNEDERGFLEEIYRKNEFEIAGFRFDVLHAALSYSKPRVLRGIHTEDWTKLVLPLTGKMTGVYVDVRPESETFSQMHTEIFDYSDPEVPHKVVLIPPGVGNSICVTGTQGVLYFYANSDYWEKDRAKGISLFDPDLNINWPLKNPIISKRDRNNPTLRELFPGKFKNR